jgi:hypothetical protein
MFVSFLIEELSLESKGRRKWKLELTKELFRRRVAVTKL